MALKSEETRELILKVAMELFIKKGFKSVTMSDLESATGLTKGAFYHHFKDKTEIFEAAVKRIINGLRLKMDEEVEKRMDLKSFMNAYSRHINSVHVHICNVVGCEDGMDVQWGSIMVDVHTYMPDFIASFSSIIQQEAARWERVIFRARENKEIRADIDLSTVAHLFLNIPESIKRNRIMGKSIEHSLLMMNLQFEQLYSLLKI